MMLFASQLMEAAGQLRAGGRALGVLVKEDVPVTPDQLETAGRILAEGPQPVANGVKSDMPGFVEADQQEDPEVLLFQVGILPSRTYRIARDGTALEDEA